MNWATIMAAVITAMAAVLGTTPAGAPAAPPAVAGTARPTLPPQPVNHLRILALGDSITAGVNSTDGLGYRGPLDALLPARYVWVGSQGCDRTGPTGRHLCHEGHSGWTLDELAAQARTWTAAARPSHVAVLGGANDNGRGDTAAQMLADLRRLLDEIRAAAPRVTLVVMTVPITTYNSPAAQQEEREYNAALPGLVAGYGRAWVVDVAPEVPVTPPHGDWVHPGDGGYAKMAELLAPGLQSVVGI